MASSTHWPYSPSPILASSSMLCATAHQWFPSTDNWFSILSFKEKGTETMQIACSSRTQVLHAVFYLLSSTNPADFGQTLAFNHANHTASQQVESYFSGSWCDATFLHTKMDWTPIRSVCHAQHHLHGSVYWLHRGNIGRQTCVPSTKTTASCKLQVCGMWSGHSLLAQPSQFFQVYSHPSCNGP